MLDDAFNYLKSRGLQGVHQSVDVPSSAKLDGIHVLNGHSDNGNAVGLRDVHGHDIGVNNTDSKGHKTNGAPRQKSYDIQNFDGEDAACAIIPLSAADDDGPRRQAEALEKFLAALPREVRTVEYLSDLVHTLTTSRTLLDWRAFALVDSTPDAMYFLKDVLTPADLSLSSKKPELSLIFTGQGAQYARMALGLLRYTTFKDSLYHGDAFLKTLGCAWNVFGVLSLTPAL